MIWCSGQNDKSDSTYKRDKEPRKIRPIDGNVCVQTLGEAGNEEESQGRVGSYVSHWQVWRTYPAACLTKLRSLDWRILSLARTSTMIRRSSSFFLPLQNADSGWSLSSASGSVWAAASPQSAVSRYTPRGKVRGTKSDTHNSIAETYTPPPQKKSMNLHNHISVKSNQYRKLLSCRVAFLTELTIISHTINPQLVTVYCVCVAGSFLTTR